MSGAELSEVEEFLALLRQQPGDWNRAKAEAFERLVEAFPDPDGPPEWALRQIARGQFDRRLPPQWRPVFVEVFHQWLGFRAESDAAREEHPSSLSWWLTSFVPALRAHGWMGAPLSPLGLLLVALLVTWSGFVAASQARSLSVRRTDAALRSLGATAFDSSELHVRQSLDIGSDPELLNVLASGARARVQRDMLLAERKKALAELDAAAKLGGTWWAWPWRDFDAR